MASAVVNDSSETELPIKALHLHQADMKVEEDEEEEEEEELFEINLEAVNSLPPPHYWESYFTATSNTLLANCLLPISDVSNAIPMASSFSYNNLLSAERMTSLIMVAESLQKFPGKFRRVPCYVGAYGIEHKEMRA